MALLPWTLPVFVWLAVHSWRPFFLGFYHDDWATLSALSISEIPTELAGQLSRPLYGLLLVVFRVILPFNVLYWHTLLLLLVALSTLALASFARRLAMSVSGNPSTATWSGALAAGTWLATPWDLGVTAWPTPFAAQIVVIGFCVMGSMMISDAPLRSKLVKALSLFLAISLLSEVFWLSFLPLLVISTLVPSQDSRRRRLREAAFLLSGFVATQLLLFGFNRAVVYFGIGINRTFNPSWPHLALASLKTLPGELERSVVWPVAFWVTATVLLMILFSCGAFHSKRQLVGGIVLAISSGAILSLLLFSLAGYRVESIGIFSRTTLAISVWLSLVPALTLATAAQFGALVQRVALGASLLLVVILSASSIDNLQAWIRSWEFEKRVLHGFPGDELAKSATANSFILVDAKRPQGAVEGLEAFWDITGALYTTYPELRAHFTPTGYRQFATMADLREKETHWDGSWLTQAWCDTPDAPLWRLSAPGELYYWRYSDNRLLRFDRPVKLGCRNTEASLK